jgi:hypothetical protein
MAEVPALVFCVKVRYDLPAFLNELLIGEIYHKIGFSVAAIGGARDRYVPLL